MLVAIDKNNKRYVSTDPKVNYKEKGFYICQQCTEPVLLRKGRRHHFAHYPHSNMRCNPWEQDTQSHILFKETVYNYFKQFSWVKSIDYEFRIQYNNSFLIPDISITTIQDQKIAIEVQIAKKTDYQSLQKTKKYTELNIATLFIFDKDNYLQHLTDTKTMVPYVSADIRLDDQRDLKTLRYYIYDSDTKKLISINRFKYIATEYEGTYSNDIDFSEYHIRKAMNPYLAEKPENNDNDEYSIKLSKTDVYITLVDKPTPDLEKMLKLMHKITIPKHYGKIILPIGEEMTFKFLSHPIDFITSYYNDGSVGYAKWAKIINIENNKIFDLEFTPDVYKGLIHELENNNIQIDSELKCIVNHIFTIKSIIIDQQKDQEPTFNIKFRLDLEQEKIKQEDIKQYKLTCKKCGAQTMKMCTSYDAISIYSKRHQCGGEIDVSFSP